MAPQHHGPRTISTFLRELDGGDRPLSTAASSSETVSTVPAYPSVSITALPTSSVWACKSWPGRGKRVSAGTPHDTPIWKLEAALKCRSCKKAQYAPPVHMIKLTTVREITPYLWAHPDDDDRR
jgi:hypothetical protein